MDLGSAANAVSAVVVVELPGEQAETNSAAANSVPPVRIGYGERRKRRERKRLERMRRGRRKRRKRRDGPGMRLVCIP